MSSRRAIQGMSLLGILSLVMTLIVVSPSATANHTIDLTVRITKIADLGGGLDDNAADLYAAVVIDGQVFHSFDQHVDDLDTYFPRDWIFTKNVPLVRTDEQRALIPVTMSVWDHDSCSEPFCTNQLIPTENDDKGDVKAGPGDEVTIFVDPIAVTWSGDVTSPTQCSTGDFGSRMTEICWQITTNAVDSDGDGLLDDWEINGLDLDHQFPPEVDLPRMGADPNVPDIFLELDYTPGQTPARDDIRAMVRAFAAAGINLHVDVGDLIDPNAVEGQVEGTCMDDIDNGGDGQRDGADTNCDNINAGRSGEFLETSIEDPPPLVGGLPPCADGVNNDGANGADANDPSCRVSDFVDGVPDGGGPILDSSGNVAPALFNCGIDATFYAAKNGGAGFQTNFNPNRRWVFRYAISTANDIDTDGAGPDMDTCTIGGQGEIGGNDFIEYNHDGGTIMHELGHNLNLGHGGEESDGSNCDPNHVSGMNYDLQFGIPRVNGGVILDFSPPRLHVTSSSRGNAPLAPLVEQAGLDETAVLDPSDSVNRFIFVDATGQKITNNLNARPNWNGDTISDGDPATPDPPDLTDTGVTANINDAGPADAAGNRSPRACINNLSNETLDGHHDWDAIVLPFLQFGDSPTQALFAEQDPVPTLEERDALLAAINTADVSVMIADSPDPVGAGERLTYTLTAGNHGPNPATSVEVTTMLPSGVVFVDTSVPCVQASGLVKCNLGELLVGGIRTFTIRIDVPADFLYPGGAKTISATARVDNLAGPDPTATNNTASEDTRVITKADVKITGVTTTSPLEVLIGQQASATIDVTVENGGPSSPVDTTLTGSASADAGMTVSPTSTTAQQTALSVGTPVTVSQTFSLDCTSPGFKTVSFTYAIALDDPDGVDPDTTNNTATVSFAIDCVVPIVINVRPKGFPNSINLNTDATLAALTTNAGEYGLPLAFDATTIDPLSVRWGLRSNLFNGGTAMGAREMHNEGHLEQSYELDEKTRDADLDMVLHFKPADSGLTVGSTESCLKGSFRAADGNTYRFLGCDSVRVVR